MKRSQRCIDLFLILVFTLLGFLVMGYHPGLEDDGIYLTAVQSDLDPALYAHNSAFFRLQMQATVFDGWMSHFIRATGMSVAWAELFWQLISIFVCLWACHGIARRLFAESRAQWAGVAMVAAMFTLPVSGTALYLMDQHLHPRNIATALIVLAVSRILAGQRWQAAPLLLLAFAFHPLMAALGVSFCFFLTMALLEEAPVWVRSLRESAAAAAPLNWAPLDWVLGRPNPGWRKALATRTYCQLYRWAWYEWLGALAPLLLFWLLWRVARKRGETLLARFALAVFAYGVFQQALAMIVQAPPSLDRLIPLQPMRYLQLVYFFMALMAGCLLGKYALKGSVLRWAAFLLAANAGMFAWQCALYSGSEHLELPGRPTANPWTEAFAWIRHNTPVDAYFALDPLYLAAPQEDYHSFRALAERSQLADGIKDAAVVIQVPELGPLWSRQVAALQGWPNFQRADFERLQTEFGVDWVLITYPQPSGLDCPWHNRLLAVCRIR